MTLMLASLFKVSCSLEDVTTGMSRKEISPQKAHKIMIFRLLICLSNSRSPRRLQTHFLPWVNRRAHLDSPLSTILHPLPLPPGSIASDNVLRYDRDVDVNDVNMDQICVQIYIISRIVMLKSCLSYMPVLNAAPSPPLDALLLRQYLS